MVKYVDVLLIDNFKYQNIRPDEYMSTSFIKLIQLIVLNLMIFM
jgi:hypothetical protein